MNTNKFEKLQRINWLISETDSLYHQASLKIGLNDSASRILYALYTSGGSCLLSEICKDSGISKQTVNSALRKLEEEDVVRLEQHHGKAKIVFLTEKGEKKANKTVSKIVDAEIGAFESWSEEEIDTYIGLTNKYAETFREQVNKL
ncbi:MAG: MarR family transcriptional regulator [Ruminiclostridium sp.]|nr:MarR family transcriptional regulator [Ruminiclostridium sp.]